MKSASAALFQPEETRPGRGPLGETKKRRPGRAGPARWGGVWFRRRLSFLQTGKFSQGVRCQAVEICGEIQILGPAMARMDFSSLLNEGQIGEAELNQHPSSLRARALIETPPGHRLLQQGALVASQANGDVVVRKDAIRSPLGNVRARPFDRRLGLHAAFRWSFSRAAFSLRGTRGKPSGRQASATFRRAD